jgi:hypothetical protein
VQRRKERTRGWRRLAKWTAIAGLMVSSIFGSCKPRTDPPKPKIQAVQKTRCYGYFDKKLRVYIEDNKARRKHGKLGKEHVVDFSQLEIPNNKSNKDPLAYFCNYSGDLIWIGKEKIFIRKIKFQDKSIKVEKGSGNTLDEIKHTLPTEYKWAGEVVSADILSAPDKSWQDLTISTLSFNGVLQLLRLDQNAFANNSPDRVFYDFANYNRLEKKYRWPLKGLQTGFVHLIDMEEIVVLPIGKKGEGSAKYFYHMTMKGKRGASFRNAERKFVNQVKVHTDKEEYSNVFEIVKPLRLDRSEGGIVMDATAEDKNGKILNLITIVKEL